MDAGSIPAASTSTPTPTVLGWGFFLANCAGSRVFARIPANTCGLRWSAIRPIFRHIPLSPGPSSLRHRSPSSARSPQRPPDTPLQINKLQADESSGWIAALATRTGRQKRPHRPPRGAAREDRDMLVRADHRRNLDQTCPPAGLVQSSPTRRNRGQVISRTQSGSPHRGDKASASADTGSSPCAAI